MDKEKLVELAKDVAKSRQSIEVTKTETLAAENMMHNTAEGIAFGLHHTRLTDEREALTEAEDELKSAVLQAYRETSERKPITGTEVKIFKSLVYDALKALDWCRTFAPTLLAVNKKLFEKMAPDMGGPVEVIETPKCTIAKDLSAYLEPATEPAEVNEGGK